VAITDVFNYVSARLQSRQEHLSYSAAAPPARSLDRSAAFRCLRGGRGGKRGPANHLAVDPWMCIAPLTVRAINFAK